MGNHRVSFIKNLLEDSRDEPVNIAEVSLNSGSITRETSKTSPEPLNQLRKSDSTKPLKIAVTMPAYKAANTIEKTLRDIPAHLVAQDEEVEIIIVDDCSPDNTVEVAQKLGLRTILHEKNLGYGGNQKTCYKTALASGADIIVLLHPDYQYDPKALPRLIEPLVAGRADFTFGSRFAKGGRPMEGGMPLYRYVGNRTTTFIENKLLGTNFAELHSGLKAYTRFFLENLPYERYSNDFVFDSQMLMEAVVLGFYIEEVPIPTRYTPESSSVNISSSIRYIRQTLTLAYQTSKNKNQLRQQFGVTGRSTGVNSSHD